ncbi:MAG: tRNA lysidine(34) synthetase TilS [Treponema sp.]|nr:tRNA lysidine(34) synthetase TilS [Treponema sp.]
MRSFEEKVREGLIACGVALESVTPEHPLGVAVSGGADSVSLLCALSSLFAADMLRVITINHNIREENETSGDARFVADLCEVLKVPCKVVTLPRGEVARVSEARSHGVEDAARFLRYEAFASFCEEERLSALCLAHNQNDEMETLLMRFLQGSGSEGGFGMSRQRGKMVRPLLDVSRTEIEAYLRARGQNWRTDSTNNDTAYLRNNIRKNLIPLLNTHFAGWSAALKNGAEKAFFDNDALQAIADKMQWNREGGALCMNAADFYAQPAAVRRRILFNAFNELPADGRVPYSVVRAAVMWNERVSMPNESQSVSAHGVEISLKSDKIYVKKCENKATESGFLDIIEEDSGSVYLRRSVQSGDVIKTKDGTMKSVQKIFGDWKVSAEDKNRIPLIQDVSQKGQPIIAILGSEFGYSDWIVK